MQAKKIDWVLLAYFALWYLGNYYYNITNKLALKAAGGAKGFPMTIATMQAEDCWFANGFHMFSLGFGGAQARL
ncbi:PPT2 [Symbiodinium pilosum]|uniref:PPT2 protein n=1 Tax=Symbiodinium pilosum TaxID=2952 RepID=A0A812SWH6_SYMPI|nr:PPT2 [Symbiodinium pilosum]